MGLCGHLTHKPIGMIDHKRGLYMNDQHIRMDMIIILHDEPILRGRNERLST